VVLFNLQSDFAGAADMAQKHVGGWSDANNGTWSYFPDEPVVFAGDPGSTEYAVDAAPPPVVIPEHDKMYVSSTVNALGYTLAALDIGTAGGFLIWTVTHKSHKVVRYGQPKFLVLVATGAIVSGLTIPWLAVDDSSGPEATEGGGNDSASRACNAAVWFYAMGFVLSFAPLFAKLWRVKAIFTSTGFARVSITNFQLFSIVMAVVSVDLVILMIWTASAPLEYRRTVLIEDPYGYPTKSAGLCKGEGALNFIGVLMAFHFGLLIFGNYVAYATRKVDTSFSESKYVGMAMVSNLQVLVIALPMLAIVSDNPGSNFFLRAGVIFLNDFTVQCFIFVPKIFAVHFYDPNDPANMTSSNTMATQQNVTSSNGQVAPSK
jgi:hypothetical protein